ncbi:5-hydroxytryptamine receptor 4-like [Oculina patagonica]
MNFSETNLSVTPAMTSLSSGLKYVSVSVYAVIILMAFVGNLIACFAFIVSGIVRMSPTNHFIFSLAVSDLLTACLAMPFDLEQLLTNQIWPHGEALCVVWTSAYLITVPSSIWSLLAVSVDRYKSLQDPLNRFRQTPFMTRRRAGLVILLLWVYSGIFALMPVMGWNRLPRSVENNFCEFNITPEYSLLSSFVNFVLPTLFMCALYWRIYKIASGMSKKEGLNRQENSPHTGRKPAKSLRKKIKTTKNILVVACAFFFCWMPHTVLSIVTTFMYILCMPCLSAIPGELYIIFLMLGYSSSALNPYLYALRNTQFRNAFSRVATTLRCKFFQRHPSPRTSGKRQSSSLLRNQGGQSTATRTTTL